MERHDTARHGTANCHNFLDGPPFLRSSCPHGLVMLQQIHPTAARAALLSEKMLSVSVDWGGETCSAEGTSADGNGSLQPEVSGPCSLLVRRMGVVLVRQHGMCFDPLHVSFDRGLATAGTPFVAELCWHGGRRHLHILAPPLGGSLNLDGLVLPPGSQPKGLAGLLESITAAEALAPPLPTHANRLERGFGLEMELLTEALPSQPTGDPTKAAAAQGLLACGGSTNGATSWQWAVGGAYLAPTSAELHVAKMRAALVALRGAVSVALSPALAAVHAALSSCEHWRSEVDVAIQPSPACLASRMVDATAALSAMADGPVRTDARARCISMLQRRGGIRKSEFQSPSPPHELRFSQGAALEIGCFIQGALATMGAAASSVSAAAHSGTAVHVHVNVRNAASGGLALSAGELLDVVIAWIRFDLVTQTYARPWLWCEPSATPLYATGAEMGMLVDVTWEEITEADMLADLSRRPPPSHKAAAVYRARAANEGVGDAARAYRTCENTEPRKLYHVPAFVSAAYAIVHGEGFDELDDSEQIQRLFGPQSPGGQLGRYCSLNLGALIKYGTLEVRRFHGTLDATLLVRWAHFCVCFVEAFVGEKHGRLPPPRPGAVASATGGGTEGVLRGSARRSSFLDGHPSAEAAVHALQSAQEMATSEELMACMADYIDARTAAYFAHDACGAA